MKNVLLLAICFTSLSFFISSCSGSGSDAVAPQDQAPPNPNTDPENPNDPNNPGDVNVVKITSKTIFILEGNEAENKSKVKRIIYINGVKAFENIIAEKPLSDIRQIEVDTAAKYVFWRGKDNLALYRRKLDGSDAEKLIAYTPESFGIDLKNKRLYFINGGTLKSADYNGGSVKNHLVKSIDLSLPQDLSGRYMYVDGASNRLYWIKRAPGSALYSGDLAQLENAAIYDQVYSKAALKITDIAANLVNACNLDKQGNYIYYAFYKKIYRNVLPGPSVSETICLSGDQATPAYFLDFGEKKLYHTSATGDVYHVFRKSWDGAGQAEKVDLGIDPKLIRMMIAF